MNCVLNIVGSKFNIINIYRTWFVDNKLYLRATYDFCAYLYFFFLYELSWKVKVIEKIK